jgi:hypothetical protein
MKARKYIAKAWLAARMETYKTVQQKSLEGL